MRGRDDRCVPRGTDSLRSPAPSRGGELEWQPSPVNVAKRISEYREFVATRSVVASCDSSSLVCNQIHANQKIDMSGAVMPLASALPVRVSGIEIPVRPPRPLNQRHRIPARSFLIAGVVRFARLCVLIEPNPAGARSTATLTGFCIFIAAARRACSSNLPNLMNAADLTAVNGPDISDDAVSTYNFCSCGPGKSRRSPRGCCRAILPPEPYLRDKTPIAEVPKPWDRSF